MFFPYKTEVRFYYDAHYTVRYIARKQIAEKSIKQSIRAIRLQNISQLNKMN